jgi:hypothetical protein
MMGESSTTGTLDSTEVKASVLITISTPGADTPICRLGNSEEVVKGLTVRDLIERIINPNSLFSVGVPISQLQAESETALAIGEMLSADCCEVVAPGKGSDGDRSVSLDDSAREVANEQVGAQGNRFLNISLEVRSAADSVAPWGGDRRQTAGPPTVEAEPDTLPAGGAVPASWTGDAEADETVSAGLDGPREMPDSAPDTTEPEGPMSVPIGATSPLEPEFPTSPTAEDVVADEGAPDAAFAPEGDSAVQAERDADEASAGESADSAPARSEEQAAGEIVTIVAETPAAQPRQQPKERKEYVRKADWLRAQFLPEVETLDFSGLFVGNLGLGIREEKVRKNVVLADPSRITEVLLRANGYRRSGDHPKALICYQELVDMDAGNADFRFLLGKTLMALGQREQASEAFLRARDLGHDGAEKELTDLKRSGHRPRTPLGFLRFWKQ